MIIISLPPPACLGSPCVCRSGSKTSSFIRGCVRASSQPPGRSFLNPTQARSHLRLCRTAEQRDVSGLEVCFQARHCVRACAVGIGEEQPEVEESVSVGELLTNGPKRVRVAAEPRVGQQGHSGQRPSGIRQQSLGQGLQDVPVPGRIFRNHENPEAHSAASSQPSERSSEIGFFFTTSMKCGTSVSAQMRDSPVSSSRLQTNVVR